MENQNNTSFHFIHSTNSVHIDLVANWCLSEWNIPREITTKNFQSFTVNDSQFQVLMTQNGTSIATGGIYKHVGILDKVPHLNVYKNGLALVYTIPPFRQKGIGAMVYNYIQDNAKSLGMEQIHLFTHTAENLYIRLGWEQAERIELSGKDIVIMRKQL
jgi:GNAT superfamily N-acetyltransferase